MTLWDVLGLGAVAVDDLFYVDHHPAPDTKVPLRDFKRQGGGLAGTALVAAARLGAKAAYCGVLGDDELSQFSLREFEREGVDCTPVLRRPEARAVYSAIIVDQSTGQRCILYSHAGVMAPLPEQITPALVTACRVLFVDSTVAVLGARAAEIARRHNIPVVGDVETHAGPDLPDLLRQIDHLILGDSAAQQLTGEADPAAAAQALSRRNGAWCVVTVGDRGCWYAARGEPARHVPALRVEAVDTTGCGDVFHGAYAAALAQGEHVSRAVQVATVAAGIKATRHGGRAGIPDRATVARYMREHGFDA
ncbi:MAG: PfkB family carbohydrate kinase [Anaerolineae bacterium]|nr:PfkB family carbohydrate kinase [Anaerolineae bacterium]